MVSKVIAVIIIMQGVALLFQFVPSDVHELSLSFNGNEYTVVSNTPFYFRQDINITPRSWFWRLFNKINVAISYWLIYFVLGKLYNESKPYLIPFVIFKVALIMEYVLSYNSPWFSLEIVGYSFRIGLTHFFIIFTFMILSRIKFLERCQKN